MINKQQGNTICVLAWESPRARVGAETGAGFGWSNTINPLHWQAASFSFNLYSNEADLSDEQNIQPVFRSFIRLFILKGM